MGKIINIDDYRKNEVKITNKHQQVKIEREESNNFTKAKGLNNIKYAGIGTLLILGEVICSISVVHSIINFKFNSYNVVELSSAIGFFISFNKKYYFLFYNAEDPYDSMNFFNNLFLPLNRTL